ncbi:MAG: hypothetical protein V3U45_06260 [bacterium]
MIAIKLAGLSPHPPIIVQTGVKRGPLLPPIEAKQRVAIARPKALNDPDDPAQHSRFAAKRFS